VNVTPRVVIGVGNEFRRDDGVGPLVLAELEKSDLPPDVTLTLSDGEPTQLFEAWTGAAIAVVIDAVMCEPSTPGKVHRTTLTGGSLTGMAASTHGLGIPEAVQLADALDLAPLELVVYAVEAGDLGFGVGLSDPVARAVPEVVQAVLDELVDGSSKH
jgi:hydrogenase maturation protease